MSSTTEVLSNWSTLIENFQASPQAFYAEVTKAVLKRRITNLVQKRFLFRHLRRAVRHGLFRLVVAS